MYREKNESFYARKIPETVEPSRISYKNCKKHGFNTSVSNHNMAASRKATIFHSMAASRKATILMSLIPKIVESTTLLSLLIPRKTKWGG